jgi:AcrR family transcriptional regulator
MNKDQLLLACAQVISEKGFHATSMQDIAEAVDLQKASLYHHFTSKQEILLVLLDQAIDLLTERLDPIVRQDLPADQKLRAMMRCFLETLAERKDLVAVLLLEYRSLNRELLSKHVVRRDRLERIWRKIIQQGIDSDLFCSTDAALTTRALLGVLNWTITWYNPSGPLTIDEIADHAADLFLHGLMCRKRK